MADDQFISFEEAEAQIGVTRATLLYYIRVLKIKREKFDLDKKAYMSLADFERMKKAKEGASRRGGRSNDPAA